MKNWKKMLTAVLALVLALGLLTGSALAAEEDNGGFSISGGLLHQYDGPGGDITIPSEVTTIQGGYIGGAFRDREDLTSVTISAPEMHIEKCAFYHCPNLREVNISCDTLNLDAGIFIDCDSLEQVRISCSGALTLSPLSFPDHTDVVDEQGYSLSGLGINKGTLIEYTGPGGDVVIPGSVVKRIVYSAFDQHKPGAPSITSLTLTQGVEELGRHTLSRCATLERVSLPDSVTTIEEYAFAYCPSLVEVEGLPYGADIDVTAFLDSYNIANFSANEPFMFDIQDGVLKRYVGPGGHVVIPDGVKEIGAREVFRENGPAYYGAFEDCKEITSLDIPHSVTTISDQAFRNCTGLTSLILPDSVTTISKADPNRPDFVAQGPLDGCESLRFVDFGDGLKEVPRLSGLPALEQVTLPSGLVKFSGIYDCPDLTTLELPHTVTEIGDILESTGGVTALVIPEGVVKCGDIRAEGLRELTLPSTLEKRPTLKCPELRKLVLPADGWAFKGINRADFLAYVSDCPRLGEVVNCPNEFVNQLSSVMIQKKWSDPAASIVPQSARITKLSNEITAGCATDYDKAKAISQWVVDHITYDYDYYYEGLKDYSDVPFDPEEILDKGKAVCAGFSRLTQALLVAQDIPCLYVHGTAGESHAWNLAYLDGSYLWIDNTWGMQYFGLNAYAIAKDHTAISAATFNGVKGPGTLISIGDEQTQPDQADDKQSADDQKTDQKDQARDDRQEQKQQTPVLPSATGAAYASTQTVNVDGKAVEFQCYALKDASGNATNYIKLRDLALLLSGSAAQFQVSWDGAVTITTKTAYTPNGSELKTPYAGDRTYQEATAATKVNGQSAQLAAFVLHDDVGGGYTYYQLRDLGQALGFNVGWSAEKGVFIETDKPYDESN